MPSPLVGNNFFDTTAVPHLLRYHAAESRFPMTRKTVTTVNEP